MSQPKPRIRVPARVAQGETFTIRTLLGHPMESGVRRDAAGALVPRKIVNRFVCDFEGETVFACDLEPAVAANPFLEFTARLPRGGVLRFAWTDDDGAVVTAEARVEVG